MKTNNLKCCSCLSENLEMFDNLMKFKRVSKTILTNFINFDKFVQFIKHFDSYETGVFSV